MDHAHHSLRRDTHTDNHAMYLIGGGLDHNLASQSPGHHPLTGKQQSMAAESLPMIFRHPAPTQNFPVVLRERTFQPDQLIGSEAETNQKFVLGRLRQKLLKREGSSVFEMAYAKMVATEKKPLAIAAETTISTTMSSSVKTMTSSSASTVLPQKIFVTKRLKQSQDPSFKLTADASL